MSSPLQEIFSEQVILSTGEILDVLLSDSPAEPAAFANPDHDKQLRGRDGTFSDGHFVTVKHVTPLGEYEEVVSSKQAKDSLSDEALEALLDEVVEEALVRKAKKKQDPLEYD